MVAENFNRTSRREVLVKQWAKLVFIVLSVWVLLFVLGPVGLETKTLKPMADFIEENNIDANAYYYTEVEEFFEAERHMREYLGLVPGARHPKGKVN